MAATHQPDSGNAGKARVFISYSRKDVDAAEQIRSDLAECGFDAYLDKHDILPGEPWQERLAKLVEAADGVAFLVSPDSITSPICEWEVNEAERLSKRVLPVVVRDVAAKDVPGRLRRLNFIFLRREDDRGVGIETLATALLTDIVWVREHTRLNELASRWSTTQRADTLLRGGDLIEAERWIASRPAESPEPTPAHRALIEASRRAATRRQRLTVSLAVSTAIVHTYPLASAPSDPTQLRAT